jgi:hypothetical protein
VSNQPLGKQVDGTLACPLGGINTIVFPSYHHNNGRGIFVNSPTRPLGKQVNGTHACSSWGGNAIFELGRSPVTGSTSSLPHTMEHGGEPRRVNGTLAHTVWSYKAINNLGHAFCAGSFNNNHAVFVFSISTTSERGGSKPGQASSHHHYLVMETAYLASLLVCSADQVEAETPLYPNAVSWRFNLCQVGRGHSLSTSNPTNKPSNPKVLHHPFRTRGQPLPPRKRARQHKRPHCCPGQRHQPHAPDSEDSGGGPQCIPLCFWAAQTSVAALDLGVGIGRSAFETYLPPHTAATAIKCTYCSHVVNKLTDNQVWQISLEDAKFELECNMFWARHDLCDKDELSVLSGKRRKD